MRSRSTAAARLVLVALGMLAASAAPAVAHERAIPTLVSPVEGAVVTGDVVEVVIEASATGTPAEFQLFLDDLPIDSTGEVAGVFTTLRVDAGDELRLLVTLESDGAHTLRLVPAPHEIPEPTITRTFASTGVVESSPPSGDGATATPSGSETAGPAPAQPRSGRPPLGRGTWLIIGLGCGLLTLGVGAVVYAHYYED